MFVRTATKVCKNLQLSDKAKSGKLNEGIRLDRREEAEEEEEEEEEEGRSMRVASIGVMKSHPLTSKIRRLGQLCRKKNR